MDILKLDFLKSKLAQTACISACKHIAQSLTSRMLSSEVKAINFGAIEQLNLDLLQCESESYQEKNSFLTLFVRKLFKNLYNLAFASSIQIHGLDNDTILLCFTDIRQVREQQGFELNFFAKLLIKFRFF
jgi:hypothetical protein